MAGASTLGLNVSWNEVTNGLRGKKDPSRSSQTGGSSNGMNTLDMNARGRIVPFAIAGAAAGDGIMDPTAMPSAANVETPTVKTIIAAGSLAESISKP